MNVPNRELKSPQKHFIFDGVNSLCNKNHYDDFNTYT